MFSTMRAKNTVIKHSKTQSRRANSDRQKENWEKEEKKTVEGGGDSGRQWDNQDIEQEGINALKLGY